MKIEQTKCDQCGKIHDTFLINYRPPQPDDPMSVKIEKNGKSEYMDFCNQNCLRDFLNNAAQQKAA